MSEKRFKKEDFEDSPRFIPMEEEERPWGWYIFDTEELDYLGFSHFYTDIYKCNMVCDIANIVDYLFKK